MPGNDKPLDESMEPEITQSPVMIPTSLTRDTTIPHVDQSPSSSHPSTSEDHLPMQGNSEEFYPVPISQPPPIVPSPVWVTPVEPCTDTPATRNTLVVSTAQNGVPTEEPDFDLSGCSAKSIGDYRYVLKHFHWGPAWIRCLEQFLSHERVCGFPVRFSSYSNT